MSLFQNKFLFFFVFVRYDETGKIIESIALKNEYVYYGYPKQDKRSASHYDNVLLPMWKKVVEDFLKLADHMDNNMVFAFQMRNLFLCFSIEIDT